MFSKRSLEKELIDLGPAYYTQDEYSQCLKKLFQINKLLGFFSSTVKTLKQFSKTATVLDVGCGSGLFLLNLSRFFPHMEMLGTDISSTAIADAKTSLNLWQTKNPDLRVSFQLQMQKNEPIPVNKYDIILITLVCHHLSDDELIVFLQKIYQATNHVVIINDLHRHRLAHFFFRLISPLLFRNRLITHDGLISIRRGFTRAELQRLLQKAGIHRFQLKWCFPFRWKLILLK